MYDQGPDSYSTAWCLSWTGVVDFHILFHLDGFNMPWYFPSFVKVASLGAKML